MRRDAWNKDADISTFAVGLREKSLNININEACSHNSRHGAECLLACCPKIPASCIKRILQCEQEKTRPENTDMLS